MDRPAQQSYLDQNVNSAEAEKSWIKCPWEIKRRQDLENKISNRGDLQSKAQDFSCVTGWEQVVQNGKGSERIPVGIDLGE